MATVPIFQVLQDGTNRHLGEWRHEARTLVLVNSGFPLLGPGEHRLAGELPWVFWDMCPAGFLGRAFQRQFPELSLQQEPRLWSSAECLRALTLRGHDLSGNLLVGDESLERWRRDVADRQSHRHHSVPVTLEDGAHAIEIAPNHLDIDVDAWLAQEGGEASPSSLGGERPKLLVTRLDGAAALIKYSPPVDTPMGRRWSDLLAAEHECAQTLAAAGLAAVASSLAFRPESSGGARRVLVIERYDRLRGFGRRGAVTLYWYAMDRLGDVTLPAPDVIRTLVDDGHLPAGAHSSVALVHEFSRAIGNDDAHLGNYGLTLDDGGKASLAPFYDVLPMALAPRHDELPDARLRPIEPTRDPRVAELVEAFAARLAGNDIISPDFKALWRTLTRR